MDYPNREPSATPGRFVVGGRSYDAQEAVRLLEPFVSDERKARIEDVLEKRTRAIIPVLEGVHDLGNIGAVIRSAEGLGYQELHIIDRVDKYKKSRRTSQGTEKWIDVLRWTDAASCVKNLKSRGYAIVVTHIEGGKPLDGLDFDRPMAFVFGNEAEGVSSELLTLADMRCAIPMAGFAQSFNVSVAAAITLYHIQQVRVDRHGHQGDLSAEEKNTLRARYYARSVQAAGQILKRLTAKRS